MDKNPSIKIRNFFYQRIFSLLLVLFLSHMLIQCFEEIVGENFILFSAFFYGVIAIASIFPLAGAIAAAFLSSYYAISFSSYLTTVSLLLFYASLVIMGLGLHYMISQLKTLVLDIWDKFQKEAHDHYITKEGAIRKEKALIEKSRQQRASLVDAMKEEMDLLQVSLSDRHQLDLKEKLRENQSLEKKNSQLFNQLKNAHQTLDNAESGQETLKKKIELLNNQLKGLQLNLFDKEKALQDLDLQERVDPKEVKIHLGKIKDLSNQLKERQDALDLTRRQLFEAQSQIGVMEAEIDALKYDEKDDFSNFKEVQLQAGSLIEKTLREKDEEIERLNSLIDSLSLSS